MVNKLRKEFEETYFSTVSTTKGLESLAKNIGISKNSMRRFLGKLDDNTRLRNSTLSLIAQRLGYKDYLDYCESLGRKKYSLDFELLDIYYGIVKGQGTSLNETRFQIANYYFAEKIISDPQNLKEFVKRFADNEEALEYVLAWHPSYENIAQENYQEALLKLAKSTTKSHIQVFVYCFIYFGKFMSENLSIDEAKKNMRQIEKAIVKMRQEDPEFHAFPEARYITAQCIHNYITSDNPTSRKPNPDLQRRLTLQHIPEVSLTNRIVYNTYVTNILNILGDYENAELCFGESVSEKKLTEFARDYPHYASHIFLYKLNWAITQYNLGKKSDALALFETLPSDINNLKTFSFDSKMYFELKYLFFAKRLYPKRKDIQKRFEMLVNKTRFTYLLNK